MGGLRPPKPPCPRFARPCGGPARFARLSTAPLTLKGGGGARGWRFALPCLGTRKIHSPAWRQDTKKDETERMGIVQTTFLDNIQRDSSENTQDETCQSIQNPIQEPRIQSPQSYQAIQIPKLSHSHDQGRSRLSRLRIEFTLLREGFNELPTTEQTLVNYATIQDTPCPRQGTKDHQD